jgi:hypothetical protein
MRAAPVLGQNLPPWPARVQVIISGEDAVTGRVSSWLTQELRRMQGVEVVDSAPDWEIHVIAMQTKNQSGTVTGYALSEVVLWRFDQPEFFRNLAAGDTVRSHRDVWTLVTKAVSVSWGQADHNFYIGPTDDMRSAIERMAASFDTKQLEPNRKAWDNVRARHP